MMNRDEIIEELFKIGLTYNEIIEVLYQRNSITLSLRQLKRILKSKGLSRRKENCSFSSILNIIKHESMSSGGMLGYRGLHQKLKLKYDINISRANVSLMQSIIDPAGVEARIAKRLKRRRYYAQGPNHVWHLDGYDKIKRFGFCIHGCIDGYSRKLLWLECTKSNNCPKIIASYYLKCVEALGGTAKVIRGDCGTENVNVATLQVFLRSNSQDAMAGTKSFQFGKSTSNQDMESEGSWNSSNEIHCECLKFCFNDVIQKELDMVKDLHNCHRIRRYPNQTCPNGRPEMMYMLPAYFGGIECKIRINNINANTFQGYIKEKPLFACSPEFERLALQLMVTNDLSFPRNANEARNLYDSLNRCIDRL